MEIPFEKNCILWNDKRKIALLEENKKKFIAYNDGNKELCALQIDGGIIDEGKRCDKGLLVSDDNFFLIELKGVDINEACKQLLESYKFFSEKYKRYNYFCRAVLTKVPPNKSAPKAFSSRQRKLEKMLGKNSNGRKKLYFKEEKLEEHI